MFLPPVVRGCLEKRDELLSQMKEMSAFCAHKLWISDRVLSLDDKKFKIQVTEDYSSSDLIIKQSMAQKHLQR